MLSLVTKTAKTAKDMARTEPEQWRQSMQDALYSALRATDHLRARDETDLQRMVLEWDRFGLSIREAELYLALGRELAERSLETSIGVLDVGCGEGKTAAKLLLGLAAAAAGPTTTIRYASIDVKAFPHRVLEEAGGKTIRKLAHVHVQRDVFDPEPVAFDDECVHVDPPEGGGGEGNGAPGPVSFKDGGFDVVIIDIEPHGREREAYDRVRHLLKRGAHLCVLKHVAFIDLLAAKFADAFIDRHRDRVVDYFGEYDSWGSVRDVFVLLSDVADDTSSSRSVDPENPPRCQRDFAQGRTMTYVCSDVRGYCRGRW